MRDSLSHVLKIVYNLRKTLYGLKKLVELSIKRTTITCLNMVHKEVSEAILYIKTKEGGESLIVSIYVDDIVHTRSSMRLIMNLRMT